MAEYRDPATWPALANPDPEYVETIKARGGAPDLFGLPGIASMRKAIKKSKANATDIHGQLPGIKQEDRLITMRDGHQITVRIYSPEEPSSSGGPLYVTFHGGGWIIGGLGNQELDCRLLVKAYGFVAVNVDYRLGPEHKHPTAVYDCLDATKWASLYPAAENASAIGADPTKGFIVGGPSAGGCMSSVVSHLWRDEGLTPKLTGVHLMIPLLCHHTVFPEKYKDIWTSWASLEFADILNHKSMEWTQTQYIPNEADRQGQLFSPFLWKTGHSDLPPHFFQISGLDPVRDDGLVFERVLREEEGIPTRINVYPGLPHGFWSIFPKLAASKQFYNESVEGVGWLLGQTKS